MASNDFDCCRNDDALLSSIVWPSYHPSKWTILVLVQDAYGSDVLVERQPCRL